MSRAPSTADVCFHGRYPFPSYRSDCGGPFAGTAVWKPTWARGCPDGLPIAGLYLPLPPTVIRPVALFLPLEPRYPPKLPYGEPSTVLSSQFC